MHICHFGEFWRQTYYHLASKFHTIDCQEAVINGIFCHLMFIGYFKISSDVLAPFSEVLVSVSIQPRSELLPKQFAFQYPFEIEFRMNREG